MTALSAYLICILAIAVIVDIRTRKVPNILTFPSAFFALLFHSTALPIPGIQDGASDAIGIVSATTGMLVGFTTLFPLYIFRAMGAGDVKLMMMVGAFIGPLQTLGAAILTLAAGGILALMMALFRRSFHHLFSNIRFMLTTSAISTASDTSRRFEPLKHTAGRMPYAVAIAAGTVLQLILVRSGGWALS